MTCIRARKSARTFFVGSRTGTSSANQHHRQSREIIRRRPRAKSLAAARIRGQKRHPTIERLSDYTGRPSCGDTIVRRQHIGRTCSHHQRPAAFTRRAGRREREVIERKTAKKKAGIFISDGSRRTAESPTSAAQLVDVRLSGSPSLQPFRFVTQIFLTRYSTAILCGLVGSKDSRIIYG